MLYSSELQAHSNFNLYPYIELIFRKNKKSTNYFF
ncbi:MAG: hypothetical protein K0Q79_2286 [Flavipsychrobacter sp.]|jgi:hypothetical protein|nr:hypothetical protein [Flavipsychrobacter sp.]